MRNPLYRTEHEIKVGKRLCVEKIHINRGIRGTDADGNDTEIQGTYLTFGTVIAKYERHSLVLVDEVKNFAQTVSVMLPKERQYRSSVNHHYGGSNRDLHICVPMSQSVILDMDVQEELPICVRTRDIKIEEE